MSRIHWGWVCSFWFVFSGVVVAESGYQLPPEEVVDIVDAPPTPSVSLSPDGEWMLFLTRDAMPSLEDISRRMLRLAGIRIDPEANSQFQTIFYRGIDLRKTMGGEEIKIPVPAGGKVAGSSWSQDSKRFAYYVVTDEGTQLWVASVDRPQKPQLMTSRLSTVLGGIQWMPDGKSILCQLVPEQRGEEPASPSVPAGPNVQESSGNTSPTRTYQDLLQNTHDETVFEHHATTQLAVINEKGEVKKIGKPAIYSGVSASPDGHHLLVYLIQKPFSYLYTYRSFPQLIQVWNLNGELEYEVAQVPMADNIPIQGVRTGPRNVDWKSSEDATLVWMEALDGGDPRVKAEHRDRLMALAAPFNSNPEELLKVENRGVGITYFADPGKMLTTEYDRDRRWVRTLMHDLANPDAARKVLMDRSIRDRYGDPGSIDLRQLANGHVVVRQDGDWIYRMGRGASPKGDLPFLDRQNLQTLETERLWRCEEGAYERVVFVREPDGAALPQFLTVHEKTTVPANFFLRDLEHGSAMPLTHFEDPTPQIRGIKKQLVTYKRADGVPLSATLYLPADYQPGTRLPLLVWAYPREFNDASTAGQITTSPSRFTRISGLSHLVLLTQGYAIMDNATMPVIGDPETMNDTFIDQIVGSAQAAIDKADELGVADPHRVAVGGHSYGAFMTANLLAHSDLFKVGVARSGAYNRTLTPFGFQAERRPLWDAKSVYYGISPFLHANKINEPLLLVHGEADNNSGTFPMQSQRMFQAIKGNGGTVRLVMLPKESHGYRARESVLHTHAETIEWLDRYLKE